MNRYVYNISQLVGVALIGAGIGWHDIGAGLAAAGCLVIALTVYGVEVSRRSRG